MEMKGIGGGQLHDKPSRTTFRERLDHMVQTLRNDIITGKLPCGTFIPSISRLSKQYKLSVNSVQKGLDQLVAESLIERMPRVGIRVKDSTQHATVSISFGYYPSLIHEIDLNRLIASFHEKFPQIRVKIVPLQYVNYLEVANYYLKNEIVDVIAINHFNFNQFRHQYDDLTEIFEPLDDEPGLYRYLLPQFRENDKLLVQPIVFSPVILCYNKNHFVERNVPEPPMEWKWTDFMDILKKLENHEKLAFYFYPSTINRWPIFILQSGIDFAAEPAKKINWASDSIVDSIQTCYNLIHRQNMFSILLAENDFHVEQMFAEQKISVMMTSYFNINKLKNVSFPFDIAPLPYVRVPKTLLLTIGLALNRRSRQKEAARIFIQHLISYESQLHIRKHTYSIPALQQAAEWEGDEIGFRPPRFNIYRDISHTFGLVSDLRLQPEEMEQLIMTMNMYWVGIQSKEATVSQLSKIGNPQSEV
mgnify:CR=1 FL=1